VLENLHFEGSSVYRRVTSLTVKLSTKPSTENFGFVPLPTWKENSLLTAINNYCTNGV
jgi:hypothetical protein